MNAKKIAEALQTTRDSAAIHKLILRVQPLQVEIRARITEIDTPGSQFIPIPAVRRAAVAKGPEHVAKLDKEIEELNAELDYIAQLERELYAAHSAAEVREISEAIPGCRQRLPGSIRKVRDALKKLDDEIATLRTNVEAIGNYERAGIKFPLKDGELAELLQLREDVWKVRNVATLRPPHDAELAGSSEFPLSTEIFFERRVGNYHERKAPARTYAPDYANG